MITKQIEHRLKVYWIMVIIVFSVMLLRLAMLQLVQTSRWKMQSEGNRIRMIAVHAPRGEILDRNGQVLAKSRLVYTVYLTNLGTKEQEGVINRLVEVLQDPQITVDSIKEQLKSPKLRPYEPLVIKRNIDWQTMVRLEERRQELTGVYIDVEPVRYYPGTSAVGETLAGHLLGYVREISAKELEAMPDGEYQMGDMIGKDGLEKTYESYLRGKDGARQVEVDVKGRRVKDLPTLAAVPGNNLVLTLDAKLQETLEKSMDETLARVQKKYPKAKAGTAVVLDVKTGGVLAMVSRPTLNPNDFIGPIPQEKVDFYFRTKPPAILNRAIAASYPPGSTFKPITAMAAVDSKAVDPKTVLVNCTGKYWLPPYINCWGVHGRRDLYGGMAVSCNTYFQEAGRLAGVDNIVRVASEFGLGSKTGIDLPGEVKGLLPSPQWKQDLNSKLINDRYQKKFANLDATYQTALQQAATDAEKQKLLKQKEKERQALEAAYREEYRFYTEWKPYDTFNMSIGQGNNDYTIIQLANYVATLANGGKRMKPYLVDRVVAPDGKVIKQFAPTLLNKVSVTPETMAEVRRAMLAVTEPGGTAYWLFKDFPDHIKVAAKTGTAQTGRQGDDKLGDFHGVFVAFAPYDNPQIAFAGIIEYGYHGGESTGYLAKAVFEEYFGLKKDPAASLPKEVPPASVTGDEVPPTGGSPEQIPPGEVTPPVPPEEGDGTAQSSPTQPGQTNAPTSGGLPPAAPLPSVPPVNRERAP